PKGAPKNVKLKDDQAEAAYDLPHELCDAPKGETNLRLHVMAPDSECPPTGPATWCRDFSVSVRNTGSGTFDGKIKVSARLPRALNMVRAMKYPWTCGVSNNIIDCKTSEKVKLPKDGLTPVIEKLSV